MPTPRNGRQPVVPHVVHVARECAEIVAAGGVGDVVLQLALQCVGEGCPTTILLPLYGPPGRRRLRETAAAIGRRLPWPVARIRVPRALTLDVPMAYADAPDRTEPVRVQVAQLLGPTPLTLAFVVAERFSGKCKPYVYTAAEVRAIRTAASGTGPVCGAELPPPDFPLEEGAGHYDFFAMNVLLQKAAIAWIDRLGRGPVVVHCHDAHAAILPLLAREADPPLRCAREARFVVTAHNCGITYRQRCADLDFVAAVTGSSRRTVQACVIEGEFDPFGAAALYADHFTTVSDGYAWEVQGAWRSTSGGDSELRGFSRFLFHHSVRVLGICNGVSAAIKGPEARREELAADGLKLEAFGWKSRYRARFVAQVSHRELPAAWGIQAKNRFGELAGLAPDGCLFSFVGRWTSQKGVDIVVRAAQEVLRIHPEAALCALGEGNQPFLLPALLELVDEFPGRVVVVKGFSEELAAAVYAAGDFFLVPSRFEPCGLIDLIAQLNGNIPIVNQVGGLSKVVNGLTGIGYFATTDRENLRGLVHSMRCALELFRDPPRLAKMQADANREVRTKYTWKAVFARYAELYGAVQPPASQGP